VGWKHGPSTNSDPTPITPPTWYQEKGKIHRKSEMKIKALHKGKNEPETNYLNYIKNGTLFFCQQSCAQKLCQRKNRGEIGILMTKRKRTKLNHPADLKDVQ